MSNLETDAITAATSNGNLDLTGNGTGRLRLGDANLVVPDSDGTNGQVLQTNGSGTLSFTDQGSGGLVYLGEASGTGAASVDLAPAGMDNSLYDMYMIAGSVNANTGGSDVVWRVGTGATPTYQTSNYNGTGTSVYGGTSANPNYVSATYMTLDGGQGMYANVDAFVQIWWEWNSTNTLLQFHQRCEYYKHSGAVYSITDLAGAVSGVSTEPTGIRFLASSGNIDVNHARMYGIVKA